VLFWQNKSICIKNDLFYEVYSAILNVL